MTKRVTIKWDAPVLSERVQLEALVHLLIDKGLIAEDELLEKVKEIQPESVGLPDLRAGKHVKINDVGTGFSGNYYTEAVSHTLTSRGYEIQLTLAREELPATHRVKIGETLTDIAKRYYGSSEAWQQIAEENNIEEPRHLEAGSLITVPKL